MTKEEYIKAAKDLGYTDEMIQEDVDLHSEAEKDGIEFPWESLLIELPVE